MAGASPKKAMQQHHENRERLKTLSLLAPLLANCETDDQIYSQILPIIRQRVGFQTAAIFLLSKHGRLERKAISGADARGRILQYGWFPGEQYPPGEGFTASVIPVTPHGPTFGSIKLSPTPLADGADQDALRRYEDKLGTVQTVVSIPLNGRNQTYGVLELINKLTPNGQLSDDLTDSNGDTLFLELLAQLLASSISHLRTRQTALHLADLAKTFANNYGVGRRLEPEDQYEDILNHFVSDNAPFCAAVLTLVKGHGLHEYAAKAWDSDITGRTWQDGPLPPGYYLAGKTLESGHTEIVSNIEDNAGLFFNIEWIRHNNLKSCACLPIQFMGHQNGTLTLFTRYYHHFDSWAIEILERLSYSVATFIFAVQFIIAFADLQDEIAGRQERVIRTGRQALLRLGYHRTLTRFLHEEKNLLRTLVTRLKRIGTGQKTKRVLSLIRAIQSELEERARQLQEQMDQAVPQRTLVDLNSLVRDLAIYYRLASSRQHSITVKTLCAEGLPKLRLVFPEMHELINILLHNAVQAIEASGREKGWITIRTHLVVRNEVEHIGIEIKDNGVGITSEDLKKIYDSGFSRLIGAGGAGLGLFIAREIVQQYGGILECESVFGEGSAFQVLFPRAWYEVKD